MKTETKNCQNCKQPFTIVSEDFEFCQKMGVRHPGFCSKCGIQALMSWRNEHTLYRGTCPKCKKSTFSMYHPASPYTVYCHDCWWKDDWDAGAYAQKYDP